MKRAVVLGAGPAGLSAAYHLTEKGYHVEIVDREPRVGGLGERGLEDSADAGRHVGWEAGEVRGRLDVPLPDGELAVAHEGDLTDEQLVEHDAASVEVSACVD